MSKDGMYLCAEVGVNWCGERSVLHDLVDDLCMVEVDAIKLQLFDEDTLKGKEYTKALKKQLTPMILDREDIIKVSNQIRGWKKKFHDPDPTVPDLIITPFNLKCLKLLDSLSDRVDGIKIRAKDWDNAEFVQKAMEIGKPMYVSVPYVGGCAKIKDINYFTKLHGGSMHRIYCVPKYPPEPTDLHLNQVTHHDGISLHSPNWEVHFAAAAIAINHQYEHQRRQFYIEVHVYPSSKFAPISDMPDFKVSVGTVGIAHLREALDDLEREIG